MLFNRSQYRLIVLILALSNLSAASANDFFPEDSAPPPATFDLGCTSVQAVANTMPTPNGPLDLAAPDILKVLPKIKPAITEGSFVSMTTPETICSDPPKIPYLYSGAGQCTIEEHEVPGTSGRQIFINYLTTAPPGCSAGAHACTNSSRFQPQGYHYWIAHTYLGSQSGYGFFDVSDVFIRPPPNNPALESYIDSPAPGQECKEIFWKSIAASSEQNPVWTYLLEVAVGNSSDERWRHAAKRLFALRRLAAHLRAHEDIHAYHEKLYYQVRTKIINSPHFPSQIQVLAGQPSGQAVQDFVIQDRNTRFSKAFSKYKDCTQGYFDFQEYHANGYYNRMLQCAVDAAACPLLLADDSDLDIQAPDLSIFQTACVELMDLLENG